MSPCTDTVVVSIRICSISSWHGCNDQSGLEYARKLLSHPVHPQFSRYDISEDVLALPTTGDSPSAKC